jgi:hypothetical protein
MYVRIHSRARACYEGRKNNLGEGREGQLESGAGEVLRPLRTEVSVMTVGKGENFYVLRSLENSKAFRSHCQTTNLGYDESVRHKSHRDGNTYIIIVN